jgi:hypothetical protein
VALRLGALDDRDPGAATPIIGLVRGDRAGSRRGPVVPPGLCGGCRFSRRIETRGGSVFRRCMRADDDPAYPRYPVLPVLSCAGFERVDDPS